MKTNSSLLNITSDYTLKKIFSFVEYNRFLPLIKYNKQLQNNLQINIKESAHQNKYIEKMITVNIDDDDKLGRALLLIYGGIIFGLIYLYFFLHYYLNAILYINLDLKLYKNKDTYWEIINSFLFRKFSIFFHFYSMYVLFHILYRYYSDYIDSKNKFICLHLSVIFAHCWYEIGLFSKIEIINSFALNGKWIRYFDGLYIFLNFIYIIVSVFLFYVYCAYCKTSPRYDKIFYLTMYKNIIIKKVDLDLSNKNEHDKRKYISSIANTFEIKNSDNDLKLIKSINYFKLKKNLNELICDKKIPEFIIKGNTEIILANSNIIKLSDIKYVLKFKEEFVDFERMRSNTSIMNILKKNFLNKINIVQQGNTKYITIFEDFDEKSNFHVIRIRDSFENENTELKQNN